MERKIGIITYHNAINYGAVLQSYALSTYISKLIDDVEIIDYQCTSIIQQYKFKSLNNSFSLLNFFAHNITCLFHHKKKKLFNIFVNNHIKKSSTAYTKDSLKNCKYKVIISGSDQVFNPMCNNNDRAFFLDFDTDATKFSYAASIGSIEQFNCANFDAISLLNKFKCVSFREQESIDYFGGKLDTQTILSVDPVWLLSKEDWNSILRNEKNKKNHFILVYNLLDLDYMRKYVKKVAKEKKMKVISINRTIMGDISYFGNSTLKSNCSPEEFLELIRDCDYFFTDSFHGVSFAIIFEKKFGAFLSNKSNNTNSRLYNILSISKLSHRIVNGASYNLDEEIDFKIAKKSVNTLIISSRDYINSIVSNV